MVDWYADEVRSLADALALLTPEGWTTKHWETLENDVFAPVDERRQGAHLEKLSLEDREQLLMRVRSVIAAAIDAHRDEVARDSRGVLQRKADLKRRRRRLEVIARAVERAACEIQELPFDDQDRLARLTFDTQSRANLASIVPAAPTHFLLGCKEVPVQALQLRAIVCSAHRLLLDLLARPRATPWRGIRRELIRELVVTSPTSPKPGRRAWSIPRMGRSPGGWSSSCGHCCHPRSMTQNRDSTTRSVP